MAGIAEKYYRKINKLDPAVKLTNPQWHEVNALHRFLSFCKSEECRIRIIEAGGIVVDKKLLEVNLKLQKKFLAGVDETMGNRSISLEEKGKRIADLCNRLEFTIDSIEHFELKIPINKLTEK